MIRGKSCDACQANCVVKDGRRVGRRSAGQTVQTGQMGQMGQTTAGADGRRVGCVTCTSARMLFAGFASLGIFG